MRRTSDVVAITFLSSFNGRLVFLPERAHHTSFVRMYGRVTLRRCSYYCFSYISGGNIENELELIEEKQRLVCLIVSTCISRSN